MYKPNHRQHETINAQSGENVCGAISHLVETQNQILAGHKKCFRTKKL